jgi:hypothetical protein
MKVCVLRDQHPNWKDQYNGTYCRAKKMGAGTNSHDTSPTTVGDYLLMQTALHALHTLSAPEQKQVPCHGGKAYISNEVLVSCGPRASSSFLRTRYCRVRVSFFDSAVQVLTLERKVVFHPTGSAGFLSPFSVDATWQAECLSEYSKSDESKFG